jgi:hypothetical protein
MTRALTLNRILASAMFLTSAGLFLYGAQDGHRLAILAGVVFSITGVLFLRDTTRHSKTS